MNYECSITTTMKINKAQKTRSCTRVTVTSHLLFYFSLISLLLYLFFGCVNSKIQQNII